MERDTDETSAPILEYGTTPVSHGLPWLTLLGAIAVCMAWISEFFRIYLWPMGKLSPISFVLIGVVFLVLGSRRDQCCDWPRLWSLSQFLGIVLVVPWVFILIGGLLELAVSLLT